MNAPPLTKLLTPWIIASALFLETMDATIIIPIIPQIARGLNIENPVYLTSAFISYLVCLAIFIPASGQMADRFGSRNIFSIAICFFGLGSIACGMSHNLNEFVLARILQGFGGAGMMPVGRMILIQTFSKSELIKASSCMSIPALTGSILGPILGGIITTFISWRWIFFINIPIAIIGIFLTLRYIENYKISTARIKKFDYVGFILFGVGISGLSLGFEALGEFSIPMSEKLLIISLASISLLMYFLSENKIKHPLFNLKIFNIKTFRLTFLGSVFTRIGTSCVPFLLPLLFQLGLGLTPLSASFLLIPLFFGMILMKFFVPTFLKIFGFKQLLITNTLLLFISFLQFTLITTHTSYAFISLIVFTHGFLLSLQLSCINLMTYSDIDTNLLSSATSIDSSMKHLIMSVGLGISVLFLSYFSKHLDLTHPVNIHAFNMTFIFLAFILLTSILFFWKLSPTDGKLLIHKSVHKNSIVE